MTGQSQTRPAAYDSRIAHLEKRGAATQLIVDGKPYLALAGETGNTASSSLEYMETAWPKIVKMNANTVLVAVAWDWVEPVEGKYDFKLVDGILDGARKHNLHLIFLWFGSWKNGLSSFAPAWVKADQQRFPRALLKNGKSVEVLSTLSQAGLEADTRAYTAFMHHLREADGRQQTVVMIQLENEVGLIGDSRDRSAAAEAAFAGNVPKELLDYLQKNKESLGPDLRKLWEAAGAKTAGTWREVFGTSTATDEIFMAWHYARYLDHLARAGKAEDALPVFSNTWLVQPEDKEPGDYPSGCPEPLTLDIWKAGAPAIDINAPDVHLRNFPDWAERFHRPDNPLFVPESYGDAGGAANAFYGFGHHASIGYSPFGIDNADRFGEPAAGGRTQGPTVIENLPLAKAYGVIAEMTPLIVETQAAGTIGAAWLNRSNQMSDIKLGGYTVNVSLMRNRRTHAVVADLGYAMVIAPGVDEFYVAGNDVEVTFQPTTAGPPIAGLARDEAGRFENGRWVVTRLLGGDDCVLEYDQAKAAAANQSGSGLQFGHDGPTIQHVRLYRYQ
jgi:beta-galactosidase GanA